MECWWLRVLLVGLLVVGTAAAIMLASEIDWLQIRWGIALVAVCLTLPISLGDIFQHLHNLVSTRPLLRCHLGLTVAVDSDPYYQLVAVQSCVTDPCDPHLVDGSHICTDNNSNI